LQTDVVVTDTLLSVDGVAAADWRFEEGLLDAEHCVCTAIGGRSSSVASPLFEVVTDVTHLLDEVHAPASPLGAASHHDWKTFLAMAETKPF